MTKVLVLGDSFAADYTKKYPNKIGWPNLLAKEFDVCNIAQAGVSEYKIWKQIKTVAINNYDFVIISHTSPSRVHTRKHPIHYNDVLHSQADLMLNDIFYHRGKLKNIFNSSLQSAYKWFIHHYDDEYQKTIYDLFFNDICDILKNTNHVSVNNFKANHTSDLDYSQYLITSSGLMNHFDYKTNCKIYNDLKEIINKSCNIGKEV